MRKLLSANFSRMWKNKFFLGAGIFMIFMGVYTPIMNYIKLVNDGYGPIPLESAFSMFAFWISILIPVLCSLYIGTEYSDGTMRNKVVVGNKRTSIYFANFIVCIVAEIILMFAYIIPYLCVGIPLLGFFETVLTFVIGKVLCTVTLVLALTALFVMVATLCHSKSITSITCILGVFILLFLGVYITNRLSEPEVYDGFEMTTEEGVVKEQTELNPNYLRGTERKVYEFLFDFLPGGQIVQLSSDSIPPHMLQMSLYSVIIAVISTGAGTYIFRRKDLI